MTTLARAAVAPLQEAIDETRNRFLSFQKPDGHWVGELQGDTILESEYVLLLAFLGREDSPRARKAANYILQQQQPDGWWSNYPDGPCEISVSVKAYFALKLTGHDPRAPHMVRARECILREGGAARCNSFTRFYLALLGQLPYTNCPAVPPELMLLPNWAYINLYAMSSWTRTIVVPLSIYSDYRPVRGLPAERGIRELFLESPEKPAWPATPTSNWFSWTNVFLGIDWLYKKVRPLLAPVRRMAIRKALAWMTERIESSDGLGAIFPPMIYTLIIYRCLGISDDDPRVLAAHAELERLMIEDGDTLRLQPCLSPVWDTALGLNALAETGLTIDHPAIRWGVHWLLQREVRHKGDWSVSNPSLEPGGWCFEYRNPFYPDTDDTAQTLIALARTGAQRLPLARAAIERGKNWLLGMQNRDGGWAAFDRNIDRQVLTKVPFADHNAMLDPSCPDITGRVLEALGTLGMDFTHPALARGLHFLRQTQETHGAWPGRWGVNYLYGTWQVLAGLTAIGVSPSDPLIQRAADWLERVQQPSGAWGESPASYIDPTQAGQGPPTASQTAWAILGLLSAGRRNSNAVRAGIAYLVETRCPGGGWHEEPFTGTGFPKVFYLKYHYYALYFPLQALGRYAAMSHRQVPMVPQRGDI